MSYGTNHTRTVLYKSYPNLADKIVALQPGQRTKLKVESEAQATRFINRIYSFQHALFGTARLKLGKYKDDEKWIVLIVYPESEEIKYGG